MALFVMNQRQHCFFMKRAAEELTGYALAGFSAASSHHRAWLHPLPLPTWGRG